MRGGNVHRRGLNLGRCVGDNFSALLWNELRGGLPRLDTEYIG